MVFLVTGPDTFRARQKLQELREKFRREVDPTGLNLQTVDGRTMDVREVPHYFATTPFLARRRFVVFEHLLSAKKPDVHEAVRRFLEASRDDGHIVVFYEEGPPTGRGGLASWLRQYARSQHFSVLEGRALTAWATAAFRERHRPIAPRALTRLLAATGQDLWRLSREVEKLNAYLEPGVVVDEATVTALVAPSFDDNVFALTDAVVAGNLTTGAPLLLEHLERSTTPPQLIALLEKSLRALLVIAESGGRVSPNQTGIHPYLARRLAPLARRYDVARLKQIYADLAAVDVGLKTSAGDAKTLLLTFLARVSARAS